MAFLVPGRGSEACLVVSEALTVGAVLTTHYEPIQWGGRTVETIVTVRQGLSRRTMTLREAVQRLRDWGLSDDEITTELRVAGYGSMPR